MATEPERTGPKYRAALAPALVALAALLVGCPGPQYPNCRGDNDCRAHHEVCVNARCQQCRTTADCASGQTCLRNRCVAGVNACESDGDCGADQHCVDRRCVPRTECDENRACPSGQPCVAGHCTTDEDADPVDNHGRLCTFEPVYFAFDNSQLDDTARHALQSAAECLGRENDTRYVLIGHSDPRGTTEYNLALGERRARTAQRYLISLGVAETRVAVSSEGSEGATGTDDASWGRDRRVDFRPR